MLKIVLLNIKDMLKNEKLILFIMILCSVFSALIMNFSYGLYQNYSHQKQEAECELKELTPTINRPFTKRELKAFVDSLSEKTLNNITLFYAETELKEFPIENGANTTFPIRFCIKNHKYSSCEETKKSFENNGLISGRYISDKEEAEGACVALVSNTGRGISKYTQTLMIDQNTIHFLGKDYKIIGEYNMGTTTPIVPFLSLPDTLKLSGFLITFDNNITRSMYDEILEHAEIYIPRAFTFENLNFPDTETTYIYNNTIIISVVLAILSVLNFSALYSFIITYRKKNLAIYRILGATKHKISLEVVLECMILSFPMFILGTVIFDILLKSILYKKFIYMIDYFNTNVYIFMFLIYAIMMYIIIILTANLHIKRNILENWKEQ